MSFHIKHRAQDDAELEITSFMNLMIVLVPVLLLSLTFTQVTVHDIKLPELTGGYGESDDAQSKLEVVVGADGFQIFYPEGNLIEAIPRVVYQPVDDQAESSEQVTEAEAPAEQAPQLDFERLSAVMQSIKLQLEDRRDVVLRLSPEVDYQSVVATMDAVKSYKAVLAASVVEVELFPEISLGDRS